MRRSRFGGRGRRRTCAALSAPPRARRGRHQKPAEVLTRAFAASAKGWGRAREPRGVPRRGVEARARGPPRRRARGFRDERARHARGGGGGGPPPPPGRQGERGRRLREGSKRRRSRHPAKSPRGRRRRDPRDPRGPRRRAPALPPLDRVRARPSAPQTPPRRPRRGSRLGARPPRALVEGARAPHAAAALCARKTSPRPPRTRSCTPSAARACSRPPGGHQAHVQRGAALPGITLELDHVHGCGPGLVDQACAVPIVCLPAKVPAKPPKRGKEMDERALALERKATEEAVFYAAGVCVVQTLRVDDEEARVEDDEDDEGDGGGGAATKPRRKKGRGGKPLPPPPPPPKPEMRSQRHFRGHADDVRCLTVHETTRLAASGDMGVEPCVMVWCVDERGGHPPCAAAPPPRLARRHRRVLRRRGRPRHRDRVRRRRPHREPLALGRGRAGVPVSGRAVAEDRARALVRAELPDDPARGEGLGVHPRPPRAGPARLVRDDARPVLDPRDGRSGTRRRGRERGGAPGGAEASVANARGEKRSARGCSVRRLPSLARRRRRLRRARRAIRPARGRRRTDDSARGGGVEPRRELRDGVPARGTAVLGEGRRERARTRRRGESPPRRRKRAGAVAVAAAPGLAEAVALRRRRGRGHVLGGVLQHRDRGRAARRGVARGDAPEARRGAAAGVPAVGGVERNLARERFGKRRPRHGRRRAVARVARVLPGRARPRVEPVGEVLPRHHRTGKRLARHPRTRAGGGGGRGRGRGRRRVARRLGRRHRDWRRRRRGDPDPGRLLP